MINELDIHDFRSFSQLRISGLTQVNVIVGKNTAGKTSLLDALELLFLREQSIALVRSLWRRQEVQSRALDQSSTGGSLQLDARQLFFGRVLDQNSSFSVVGKSNAGVMRLAVTATSGRSRPHHMQMSRTIQEATSFILHIKTESASFDLPLSGKSLLFETIRRGAPDELIRPYVYVGTSGLDTRDRGRLWDLIVGNEDEDFVTQTLRTVEPNVERIIFTVGDSYGGLPTPFVRMKSLPERVPLGNLGHGATRLLETAMLLVQARDGAFLIDEIEIGLHHTIMTSVWQLIIETAQRLNIQVFATTHSQDCLRAIAGLYRDNQELSDLVSLHRLDAGAAHTERFSMDEIEIADNSKLELRGLP